MPSRQQAPLRQPASATLRRLYWWLTLRGGAAQGRTGSMQDRNYRLQSGLQTVRIGPPAGCIGERGGNKHAAAFDVRPQRENGGGGKAAGGAEGPARAPRAIAPL